MIPHLPIVLAAGIATSCAATAQIVNVPSEVSRSIATLLPETSNAGAAYANEAYSANLFVVATCTIELTFLWEGAGYRNSLGWFCYADLPNGDIQITDRGLVWPNASMPWTVQVGLTAKLMTPAMQVREFQPGEKVGFFVVADGWSTEPNIPNFNGSTQIPRTSPGLNESIGRGCYTTISRINPEFASPTPELARHVAMIDMPGVEGFLGGERYLLTGFEDLNRTGRSDDDFNDLVFVAQSDPIEAIDTGEVFPYEEGDPDADTVSGVDDHYPTDGERAFRSRYPSSGVNVLALEDEYPSVGDADYNDCVVSYVFDLVKAADGAITEIQMTVHLLARGSVHNHGFGLHLPGLPQAATGSIEIERFWSDSGETHQRVTRSVSDMIFVDQRRIPDIIPYTMQALPATAVAASYANTTTSVPGRSAASARLLIQFDTPVYESDIGLPPYDPWFQIHRGGLRDVHLPGREAFADRQSGLPIEPSESSFRDVDGFPFVLEVPTNWRFPLEKVRIEDAYSQFSSWRQSAGTSATSWYLGPTETGSVGNHLNQYVPVRDWAVKLPPQ